MLLTMMSNRGRLRAYPGPGRFVSRHECRLGFRLSAGEEERYLTLTRGHPARQRHNSKPKIGRCVSDRDISMPVAEELQRALPDALKAASIWSGGYVNSHRTLLISRYVGPVNSSQNILRMRRIVFSPVILSRIRRYRKICKHFTKVKRLRE